MKNKLLITTALVVLIGASNVYAADEIIINTDKNIVDGSGIDVGDKVNDNSQNTQKLTVTNGARLDINYPEAKNLFNVNGGSVEINDGEIHAEGIANISGGEITINGGELTIENPGAEMNISGGTINLTSNPTRTSGFGINISDENPEEGFIETALGPVEMTGGTINVLSGKAVELYVDGNSTGNLITGTALNLSGGELNISEGAGVSIIKGFINERDVAKSVVNLTDEGTVNLAGTLVSDVSGDGNLNVKSSSALVDGDVEGSNLTFEADHSLNKVISGTVGNLASLNVNKGTLTYDKQTGKIGNLNVAGGLDIGTNTVNAGNVEFKDNSTLKFTVAGKEDGSYGKIKADTINVSGNGTKLDLTLNSSVLGKDETKEFTILDGKVNGDFAELSQNSRYKFEKVGNGVYEITGTATASDTVVDAGGTVNNSATASAWDSVSLDNPSGSVQGKVANVLAELSNKTNTTTGKKAYVDALTAVAPEVAPMVQQTQTETANQVFGAVSTRLTGGSISTGSQGMSSGDSNPDAAVWVQGMFNKSKLDDTSKAKGFDADSNGVALGIEKHINTDVKIGAGYAYTNTDIDGFMRDTDVDTHTAIIYGEYKPSNWYLNGIATYGWSNYSEDKNVAGVGVNADYDVETFGLQAMTGYEMNVNGFGLTPEAGLRYVHIKQDAYKDSADQRVSANDSDILTGVIGAKISKNFELSNGMNIKPEARIAATYDLMNDDVNSVVTLANGSAYAVEGEALDRFGMEFGAGITAELNTQVELSLGYEGKFREDYQDHTGLINAKYKF